MPNTSNPWFALSIGLIGLIVGYGLGSTLQGGSFLPTQDAPRQIAQGDPSPSPDTLPPQADEVPPVDTNEDHIRGNPDATISIVEYSDFECPFCARHHPTMVKLLEDYGDDVNWVYRHYPLSFHPNAQKAAEASECANELGGNSAFWEYADTLFEKGSDNTQLVSYAKELGLNESAFQTCLDSDKYKAHTQEDMAGGTKAGVRGTPGNIIINNETGDTRLVSGAQPIGNFESVIDEMLGG